MTVIAGILGAAFLFAVFTLLRPRDRGESCTGDCAGCAHDRACPARHVQGEQL